MDKSGIHVRVITPKGRIYSSGIRLIHLPGVDLPRVVIIPFEHSARILPSPLFNHDQQEIEKKELYLKRIMVRDGICGKSADGLHMVVGILNSFLDVLCPILAPMPNCAGLHELN